MVSTLSTVWINRLWLPMYDVFDAVYDVWCVSSCIYAVYDAYCFVHDVHDVYDFCFMSSIMYKMLCMLFCVMCEIDTWYDVV